jgi:hypothetical protein
MKLLFNAGLCILIVGQVVCTEPQGNGNVPQQEQTTKQAPSVAKDIAKVAFSVTGGILGAINGTVICTVLLVAMAQKEKSSCYDPAPVDCMKLFFNSGFNTGDYLAQKLLDTSETKIEKSEASKNKSL